MDTLTKRKVNELSYEVLGAVIEVHKHLGSGLLEKVYEKCLIHELQSRGFKVDFQKTIYVDYKGVIVDCDLRYDLLIEDTILVELKAVSTMLPIFEAQLMSYMKLMEIPKGILVNFHCTNIFKEGQKTFVNDFYRMLPD
ncbi:GxxExxY protein [Arcicella sp. LKC2W]|uniref:GxxExxY protein n=1 Tax=Arcicella sp. LKC2W TaxID=2984198 RepID=UPI002B1F7FBD|nr:GxxExxY protein [Arcicella sp. LKC2W]MEA5461357.1 GxxExxY protein [Arcicella sp. LKC2W]